MNMPYLTLAMTLLVISQTGCGQKEKKKEKPTYAVLESLNAVSGSVQASYRFQENAWCQLDSATGNLSLTFIEQAVGLNIDVRDVAAGVARDYFCVQTEDNTSEKNDLGFKYENCAIAVTAPNTLYQSTQDEYAMHRDSTVIRPFRYGGGCRVRLAASGENVQGEFVCEDMAQVAYAGSPRNPVADETGNPLVTQTFKGQFNCDLQRVQAN